MWEDYNESNQVSVALTTDSDRRPHLVIRDGLYARYVSGHNWGDPSTSVWGVTHEWLDIGDIKYLGIDDSGKIIAIFGYDELISVGSDMHLQPDRVPAWDWADLEVDIEPSTYNVIVDLRPTGELTAAGTVDNRLQLRKYGLIEVDDGVAMAPCSVQGPKVPHCVPSAAAGS